ncbi:MAG: hypothetical protein MUF33_14625, partial [Candidatus Nanopelagicales bacterium]|nr:hypothetical protein [Candidatus Nanopelagicales bacterium]
RLEHVESPELAGDQERIKFLPTLKLPAYQAALGANFANGFVFFGLRSSLVPLFVVEGLQQGPGLAGAGFVVAAGLQAALLAFGGRTADHRGRRPALIIGLSVGALSLALLVVAPKGPSWGRRPQQSSVMSRGVTTAARSSPVSR